MSEHVKPYNADESKKLQVARMFDNISQRYDFLNHLLSLGIDKLWRKKLIKLARPHQPKLILDVATGTGDLALALTQLNPEKVIGSDISVGMLEIGRKKMLKNQVHPLVTMEEGDAENLRFDDQYFDLITCAFGVRNFENLRNGLTEMQRVTKTGGYCYVLEFSQPQSFPFKQIYNFYFKYILPTVGKLVSKDASAYTYLPESVEAFPYGDKFAAIMRECGFKNIQQYPLTFGIATIYQGQK